MDTIHEESLHYCINFVYLLGFILLLTCIWSLQTGYQPGINVTTTMQWFFWAACALLIIGAFVSQKISIGSPHLAGWAICTTVTVAISLILLNGSYLPLPHPLWVLTLIIPILLSAFIFPWRELLLWIGVISVGAVFINYQSGQIKSLLIDGILPSGIILLFSGLLFLITFNISSSFEWYQVHYQLINEQEKIIKQKQAELQLLVRRMESYQRYLNKSNELLNQAYVEANHARNVKQEFVQNISHELRTPLNMIIGFSETMYNTPEIYYRVNWTPELKGDIDCIYQNSRHLKALIDDVLDLAAVENQSLKIAPIVCDLNEILAQGARIMEESFVKKGLTLELNLLQEPLLVRADPVRIQQVFLNLLSNACKNTVEGGVKVAVDVTETAIGVLVADTGIGIPPDELDKVFTPFYRASNAIELNQNGTGLGLSISKHYIELHGGELLIESAMGQGTEVTFTLPILNPRQSTGTPEA